MKTLPLRTQTVDLQTGATRESITEFKIIPPPPDACQVCGHPHAAEDPHNLQSLYYQYAFRGQHGRWPTWKDALAHCSEDVQRAWERELRARNAWSELDK